MELCLENKPKIIESLNNGVCFICGRSGFKSPLIHIANAHHVNEREIKDELLLPRDKGFLEEESKKLKQELAKISGFKAGESHYNTVGHKIDKMSLLKWKQHNNNPEVKNRFKSIMAKKDTIAKATKTRGTEIGFKVLKRNLNEGEFQKFISNCSKKASTKRLGCEPDLYYAKLCYELTNGSSEFVPINYTHTAKRLNINRWTFSSAITRRSAQIKLIEIKVENSNKAYARLTPKCLNIMSKEA
jgi:hypothetical protein